jgi:hypothetical protein
MLSMVHPTLLTEAAEQGVSINRLVSFPQEQKLLSELGERLKLARLRRKLSSVVVAQRAGISRSS